MKKTVSLCDNRRFLILYRKGRKTAASSFVLYIKPNGLSVNRLGITVGKKAVGNAVKRNRAKRVIREAYRLCEPHIKTGYDFVIASRGKTPYMKSFFVRDELSAAFEKEKIFLNS
ncbi:MAG: ribonuclease P protein component [Clostridiales bacterium]|nr:ribonuclease P protein component [Clostridiales bacterium]